MLRQVQNDLFDVGADLATPIVPDPPYPPLRITQSYVDRLEGWCDEFNDGLPKLTRSSCPAARPARRCCTWRARSRGGPSAARGRCSRPSRTRPTSLAAKYLNRLSDLLFILRRNANPDGDVMWRPGENG